MRTYDIVFAEGGIETVCSNNKENARICAEVADKAKLSKARHIIEVIPVKTSTAQNRTVNTYTVLFDDGPVNKERVNATNEAHAIAALYVSDTIKYGRPRTIVDFILEE